MSADCCCDRSECDPTISGCCLPSDDGKGRCEQLTDCECRKQGGYWLSPSRYGVSPVPCVRCNVCECCGTDSSDGLYEFRGTRVKRHIFDTTFRCPPGNYRRGSTIDSDAGGNCTGFCNILCSSQVLGTCCYCGGAAVGVSKCACDQLRRANSPGFLGAFLPGSDAENCQACICELGGTLITAPAYCNTPYNHFGFGGSCSDIAANDPAFYSELVALCAAFGNGNGGGGGGPIGPPVTPPFIPRPIAPPPPPKPCTRPPVYNPTCSYKVWFVVYSKRTEDPCYNRVEEVINLYRLPDFSTDSCNTLSCCGAPAPDCTDVEAMVVPTEFKRVTNCTFGDTDTQTGDITLKCNDEQVFQRYDNPCEPCPTSRVEKLKIVCNTAQFLRGCCDTKMNFLQFQIPETGIKVNGVWTLYYPAETVILDLRNRVCEGYDRNHPSCK